MFDEISVLLVDDDQVDRLNLASALSRSALNCRIVEAENAQQARERLQERDVDCILLDYRLEAEDTLELLSEFVTSDLTEASVIMFSDTDDDEITLKFMEIGAEDYIHKGELSPRVLTRAIRYAQERKRNRQYLRKLADIDSLTHLPNRRGFLKSLQSSIARANRDKTHIALIFIDLDGFKGINDTLGHKAGDELLRVVSKRLMGVAREGDVVARLGGDEFVILLEGVVDDEKLSGFADQLKTTMAKPLVLKQQKLHLTASFGIATFPRDGETCDELLQCADAAMYRAKEAGRNAYCFYSQELHQLAKDRVLMMHDLHSAIANQEFSLHYQPIINATTHCCEKAEALIRWQHPVKGNVPPMDFIPIAEELGLIAVIGQWVLWETCRQLAEWKERSPTNQMPVISVNLSGRQLQQSELPSYIYDTVLGFGLECSDIEFEVTETHLMSDLKQSGEVLDAIVEMGCGIAIDDFGTGYSSFRHLQRLPKQTLKIDRSFVSGIESTGEDWALVQAMIDMAKILKLKVVAEGVETGPQRDSLCAMGCDYLQGYLFSKPLPKDQFFQYLMQGDIQPDLFPANKKNETGQSDSYLL